MKLAFMHIPKTGGISVERSVAAGAPAGTTTCPAYFVPDYAGKTYDDMPGYGIYQGHFKFEFISGLPADYTRAVVLRTPADQMLSLCNHIASRPKHALHEIAQGATLADLLGKAPALQNPMAKYLLGDGRYTEILLAGGPVKDQIEAAMEEIIANLESFDVIGVTPRLNRFVRDLGRHMGLKFPAPQRENKNKFITYSVDKLSAADKAALEQATWADRRIYSRIWTQVLAPRFAKADQPA